MTNKKKYTLTFIIRASGEATVAKLKQQLMKQISKKDVLLILDDKVSFEEKLKQGYELAIKTNNSLSVFIDGDILLRSNAVKRIRKISRRLKASDFGFGLILWDRFYNRPKYRGLHVYRTELLKSAINYIPEKGEQLRPESFVKKKMKVNGNKWRNDLSFYIAGLHDFYQKPQDIYYKFLIRSKRSNADVNKLKSNFKSEADNLDYKIALKGLEDGESMEVVVNNKYLYAYKEVEKNQPNYKMKRFYGFIDLFILKKIIRQFKFNHIFWKSL